MNYEKVKNKYAQPSGKFCKLCDIELSYQDYYFDNHYCRYCKSNLIQLFKDLPKGFFVTRQKNMHVGNVFLLNGIERKITSISNGHFVYKNVKSVNELEGDYRMINKNSNEFVYVKMERL